MLLTCTNQNQVLLDTGSDINIIKIDCLKGNLIIDETNRILIRGISNELIRILGTIIGDENVAKCRSKSLQPRASEVTGTQRK